MKNITNKNILYFCIFIFFFSCFFLISNGRYGGDGLENYLTAESIILDGDLAIHDRPFQIKEMNYASRGYEDPQGRFYSSYGIGMPVLLIPLYAIGHFVSKIVPSIPHDYITQFCVSLANPIIIALTALVVFIFLIKLKFDAKASFLTMICYAFCTMSLNYVRSGFSEPTVGLFVLLALLYFFMYEKDGHVRYILFAGILIGYSLLIKKNSFLYLPLFLLYIIYKSFAMKLSSKRIVFLIAGLFPIAIFILAHFYFRHLISSHATEIKTSGIDDIMHEGMTYGGNFIKALYYYIFSPGKSYFFYNVVLIFSLFGINSLWRKNRRLTLYFLICVTVPFLFYSYRFMRGSLFSWGPRYVYPTIPIMCIFLAGFIDNAKSLIKKSIFAAGAVISFMVQLPSCFISFSNYLYFVKEKLGLQEYLINFMPELSPLKGSWYIFVSAIKHTLTGQSLLFKFNPDPVFLEPISKSMADYDIWDLWWVHAVKISPNLLIPVFCTVVVLILFASASFAISIRLIKEKK